MPKNFYEILGVSKDAPEDEIKKSYRRLAKRYHPDVNKGDKQAEERFKEISEAYEVLSDKEKRKQYDLFGAYGPQGSPGGGAGFDPSQWAYTARGGGDGGRNDFGFEDFADILRKAGAGGRRTRGPVHEDLGDIFGDVFSGGRARPREDFSGAQQRGKDLYYSMEISFLEAALGTLSKISIQHDGKIEKIEVKIPAGVNQGSKIRLAGKGEPAPYRQGKPGDLYIEIKVKPHPLFWREGNDIFLEAPISVGEASLGATIRVPTLQGHAELKIPPGTPSNQKFRLKEKGVINLETKTKGDLYIITNIVVPKTLNEKSKELIQEFESLNPLSLRSNF